jgi:hypothetical protein
MEFLPTPTTITALGHTGEVARRSTSVIDVTTSLGVIFGFTALRHRSAGGMFAACSVRIGAA